MSGAEPYLFPLAHAHKIPELQVSLVIFDYHECIGLAIWRKLSVLFVFLFIHSISYELFIYVTLGSQGVLLGIVQVV